MGNHTRLTAFILAGLTDDPEWKVALFAFLLLTYLLSVTGNLTIIILTLVDTHLKTPMYFFLRNFSFLEISYTTTCIPKLLAVMATGDKSISYNSCVTQVFFAFLLGASEFYLLAAMSCDRYVAICHPLRYPMLMNEKTAVFLAGGAWLVGLLNSTVHTASVLLFPFCGPRAIDHFFCEVPAMLKLSCADTSRYERGIFVSGVIFLFVPFCMISASYGRILHTVLQMRSSEARKKAFSTCSFHMVVVGMYYGPFIFTYMRPRSYHSPGQDKLLAVFYTIVTPTHNPVIYSFRNKDVLVAMKTMLGSHFLPEK